MRVRHSLATSLSWGGLIAIGLYTNSKRFIAENRRVRAYAQRRRQHDHKASKKIHRLPRCIRRDAPSRMPRCSNRRTTSIKVLLRQTNAPHEVLKARVTAKIVVKVMTETDHSSASIHVTLLQPFYGLLLGAEPCIKQGKAARIRVSLLRTLRPLGQPGSQVAFPPGCRIGFFERFCRFRAKPRKDQVLEISREGLSVRTHSLISNPLPAVR